MEAQVNQLEAMSQTLESAGFTHHQSHAVIKSVAQAMETFAVTPAVLDSRIDKVLELFAGQNADIKVMRGDIKELRGEQKIMRRDIDSLREGQDEMRGDIKGLVFLPWHCGFSARHRPCVRSRRAPAPLAATSAGRECEYRVPA